ncbi:hypothetical protein HN827_08445 [archaeon]|jgi:hypothetical protein|nr:hypothetical protein [archaeon]MBT7392832.1 hypothetical protein [archaeon]
MLFLLVSLSSCWNGFSEFMLFGGSQKSWQEKAIEKHDVKICDKASHPDTCRLSYSRERKDARACESIETEAMRSRCFLEAQGY